MSNEIKFCARTKYDFDTQLPPKPAASLIPNWWKELDPYDITPDNPEGKFQIRNRKSNATAKKCVPMLDGLTSGYIIQLWADVQVEQTPPPGIPGLSWRTGRDLFTLHGISSRELPTPTGYDPVVFKYDCTWTPITPPGYSTLVIPPMGYQDSAFKAVPAVLDSDKSTINFAFPMWIKTGFEGIVEKGTPLVQLIPFKRDNWTSSFDYYKDNDYNVLEEKTFNGTLIGNYLKNNWSKKTYK